MSVASAGRPKRERKRRKTARRRSKATPHKPFLEHSARSESIAARSRRLLGRTPPGAGVNRLARIGIDARKLKDYGIGSYIQNLLESLGKLPESSAYRFRVYARHSDAD